MTIIDKIETAWIAAGTIWYTYFSWKEFMCDKEMEAFLKYSSEVLENELSDDKSLKIKK